MTKNEFNAWKQVTEASRHHWVVDQTTLRNRRVHLIYKGGESGQFIEVTPEGKATIGDYVGAIPHIGEALFTPKHSRQFANGDEALAKVIEVMGLKFLLDFVGIPAYR